MQKLTIQKFPPRCNHICIATNTKNYIAENLQNEIRTEEINKYPTIHNILICTEMFNFADHDSGSFHSCSLTDRQI